MSNKKLPASQKLLNALSKPGATLTTKQAQKRFNITNVSARIADLRYDNGVDIRTNVRQLANGRRSYFYSLGQNRF